MRIKTMLKRGAMPVCALLVSALSGCADVPGAPITVEPVQSASAVPQIVMSHDQEISVSAFYTRTLRGKTHWKYVASLPEGDIYRPVDTVFTVESGNVQEAYLVIRDHSIAGYFLPVERHFVKVDPPVSLDFDINN